MAEEKPELVPDEIILGEANYREALNLVIASAESELLIFDEDLSKGDYASLKRFELIRDFLSKGSTTKLIIILHDTAYFTSRCPRLFALLQTYGHLMSVYQTTEQAKVAKDIFIIADQKHYLRRFHVDQARFKYAFDDEKTANMLNMRFDELREWTGEAVSPTTLGL
ncbi:hypothetical protein A7981_03610 [Methylovorus sp. MM2]|uniref:DUF7931 domain-containing protein n=1 Tax=Methylovorus sp. MM2 TaxID=1848038 RepID=UPI0007E1B75F|nr:hypothetical protein [Methylovorus sp. MM2]OAM52564.1 hypothetical protein A7981_03610 [Methylovorus sp. MM2]